MSILHGTPDPRNAARVEQVRFAGQLPRLVFGAMIGVLWLLGCASRPTGPDIGRLPTITSGDPVAEGELSEAREARNQGKPALAERLYRRLLQERPDDPLAALAKLELGQLLLQRESYGEAQRLFSEVQSHPQPAVAEQARFLEAVARAKLGDSEVAARTLRDMVGRTVAPEDTGLLLLTLAQAEIDTENMDRAVIALDRLLSDTSVLPEDRAAGEQQLTLLLERRATPEQVNQMLDAIEPESPTYEPVLRRALADAQAARDDARVRELLEDFQDAGIPLDDDLRALAMQAAEPQEANPQAIGAILSLSGRARRVGEYALRGLMLAANLPPQEPAGAQSPQLVFRDDSGDPLKAVKAVDELVNIHRVVAIIGPMEAQAARAAAQRAAELGVPLLALSPTSGLTDLGPNVFQALPTAAAEAQTLAAYARSQGQERIAILHPDNIYGVTMRDLFTQAAQAMGLAVVAMQEYAAGDTAFGRQVAELEKQSFDALFLPDGSERIALIAPALAAGGLWSQVSASEEPPRGRGVQVLAPSVGFSPELVSKSGRYLQGAVFTTPYAANEMDADSREFAARYMEQFGTEPNAFSAVAHDAYSLVLAATHSGAVTREAVVYQLPTQRAPSLIALRNGLANQGGPTMPVRALQLVGDAMREAHIGPMVQPQSAY